MEETYKIYIEFTYGNNDSTIEICKASKLKQTIERLMYGPFASIGGIKRFRVIDDMDFTIFSVEDGKVTFPRIESVSEEK
jgi:hypothetical protein